jgi:rhamnogalacturonan endolyase
MLLCLLLSGLPGGLTPGRAALVPTAPPVTLSETAASFTLANGLVTAQVDKRSGALTSLVYQGLQLLDQGHGRGNGGYWSSVGRGQPGSRPTALVLIDPSTNGGERAEIGCRLTNNPRHPVTGLDAEYRYALGRGDSGIYVSAVLTHPAGYPAYGVGEARYCLKLNPAVFDYLSVDADRQRLMPSGYDWDHGVPLNLKEARRMTTGVHQGEVEHKYDYAAVLADTPAYGWSSSTRHVGLWLVNPSLEYLGGGPTKVELTGHLDVNPGGLPTLLNMWVGSHYGGTVLYVAPEQSWTKVVGPFLLYCNAASSPPAMWRDALARAAQEKAAWPYAWAADQNFPAASARATVTGRLVVHDPGDPDLVVSNLWAGVSAPDYPGPRGRPNGMPPWVDWQRDAMHYQFWARADQAGNFTVPNIRPGRYTLHAIADGVLGEFTLTNVIVEAGQTLALGELAWVPRRFGPTLWQIGVPDRTAREFRHGDHYWQWGLYFDYPREFPDDVHFIISRSNWRTDWNYVQPPRIKGRNVAVVGEDDDLDENTSAQLARRGLATVRSTPWTIQFQMPRPAPHGAVLRLAFCGTHRGCNVEAFVNGRLAGETGELPGTSAMQRDGIRAYWLEKDLPIAAELLTPGTNTIQLLSRANSWSQGVMYDCLRLEARP